MGAGIRGQLSICGITHRKPGGPTGRLTPSLLRDRLRFGSVPPTRRTLSLSVSALRCLVRRVRAERDCRSGAGFWPDDLLVWQGEREVTRSVGHAFSPT